MLTKKLYQIIKWFEILLCYI